MNRLNSKAVRVPNSVDVKSNLQGLDLLDLPDDQTDIDLDTAIQDPEAAPVIALVNKVLVKALKRRLQIFTLNRKKSMPDFCKDGVLGQALSLCLNSFQPYSKLQNC